MNKEDLTDEELKKVEKLERKLHKAILAIKKKGEGFNFCKQWSIIDSCRLEIRKIMQDENYEVE